MYTVNGILWCDLRYDPNLQTIHMYIRHALMYVLTTLHLLQSLPGLLLLTHHMVACMSVWRSLTFAFGLTHMED